MYNKNIYDAITDEKMEALMSFAEEYKEFLSYAKTERLATKKAVALAEEYGFRPAESFETLKEGDKVYFTNRKKNIALFVIGKKPVSDGIRILGAHIDSPRMDVKQNPVYEANEFALLDTHYYGGIKKYQWVTIPLALHGVVVKKNGEVINVNIGEDENDPVLGITDLLIHFAREQLTKTAAQVIEGEKLDVSLGSIPLKDAEKDKVKANVLHILKEKYDIEEEDFLSAEIEVVPAGKARDYGLDRSMIAGYGHDDRVCAYTSLRAVVDTDVPEYTSCCILVDKEEVGSIGATGAHSVFFENTILELLEKSGNASVYALRKTMEHSRMLSSDVSAGFDPLYAEVNEPKNACYFNHGIVFMKFTGSGGKGGSNDASAEYVAWVRNCMDEAGIYWQTSELGRVDVGGGGTIAYILGNYNMDVVDAGISVHSMHSPMEIVAKADVYEAYLAYKAFLLG